MKVLLLSTFVKDMKNNLPKRFSNKFMFCPKDRKPFRWDKKVEWRVKAEEGGVGGEEWGTASLQHNCSSNLSNHADKLQDVFISVE